MPKPKTVNPHLPTYMRESRGTYYMVTPREGKWVRLDTDLEKAKVKLRELLNQKLDLSGLPVATFAEASQLAMFAVGMYRSARTRALARGTPWHLTEQDVLNLLGASGGRCQLSGIPFSPEEVGKRRLRPWMPSLDRISAAGGYELSNVRVVCLAANIALSDFGDGVLVRLAQGIVSQRLISSTLVETLPQKTPKNHGLSQAENVGSGAFQ